jgi:hypothetical protein
MKQIDKFKKAKISAKLIEPNTLLLYSLKFLKSQCVDP